MSLDGTERKCPICGKVFLAHEEWAYKKTKDKHSNIFCSWGCLRKWEAQHGSRKDRQQRIINALSDGLNPKEAALLLGEPVSKVWYWEKKLKREAAEDGKNERSAIYGPD